MHLPGFPHESCCQNSIIFLQLQSVKLQKCCKHLRVDVLGKCHHQFQIAILQSKSSTVHSSFSQNVFQAVCCPFSPILRSIFFFFFLFFNKICSQLCSAARHGSMPSAPTTQELDLAESQIDVQSSRTSCIQAKLLVPSPNRVSNFGRSRTKRTSPTTEHRNVDERFGLFVQKSTSSISGYRR